MSLSHQAKDTKQINIFQPSLGAEEVEAVRRVFASNWIGKGKLTDQFESAFSGFLGVERTLMRSVNCCTEGLFQSMALLGLGKGDEVVLPSISFIGAANAVVSCGARPVFCDVDTRTLNSTAKLIEQKLTLRTKAVIILHYGGVPCRMDEICNLLSQRGVALIEDVAYSVASRYKGKACGTFGDVGVWSFDAMKILVTGDGGMVYCKTQAMARRVEQLLYLGLTTSSGLSSAAERRWWEFDTSCHGRRAITNDLASAIGLEQLKKLPRFIRRRKEIHAYYNRELARRDWLQLPPDIPSDTESSYYFYWVQTRPDLRDRLALDLRSKGVYTTFRYYPLHWVKSFGESARLPHAEEAARSTLCIPLHQSLSEEDLERITHSIRRFGTEL